MQANKLLWQTVYYYFRKWRDDGTLLDIFEILNSTFDIKTLCIDSTLVKAHQHALPLVYVRKP